MQVSGHVVVSTFVLLLGISCDSADLRKPVENLPEASIIEKNLVPDQEIDTETSSANEQEEEGHGIEGKPDGLTPVGYWVSVDFVTEPEDFQYGQKASRGNLYLEHLRVYKDGRTSLGDRWEGEWIVDQGEKVKAKYLVKEIEGKHFLFLPWLSGDVTIRGQKPKYYVLVKVSGNPNEPDRSDQIALDYINEYDDVRGKDLSGLDLSTSPDLIATLWFNEKTIWPATPNMPPRCSPRKLMTEAMNLGLGIRALHQQGITGKGVTVAIIDQPLYRDHPEFAGKIIAYHDVGCESESSMHGPAVASLLVGTNCGTAPDAKVYFVAAPSWTRDSAYQAKALDWILERNKELDEQERIKVVSVSAAPSGPGSPFEKNQEMWDEACARAADQGVLVLDCTHYQGFIGPCYYDLDDPEDVAKCTAGFPGAPARGPLSDRLLVPCSPRTTAEEYAQGECSYQYCGRGGLSWSIPYCAGVLALGWQLNSGLSGEEMREILFRSAHVTKEGARIIDPTRFIQLVRESSSEGSEHDGPLDATLSGSAK